MLEQQVATLAASDQRKSEQIAALIVADQRKTLQIAELSAEVERLVQFARTHRDVKDLTTSRGEDIIRFNVGGQAECAMLRKTLCLVEGSMLANMFSGRWDIERDEQGRVFVDFPPELFLPLMDFLRLRAVEDPAAASRPRVLPDHLPAFRQMVQYYGLGDMLWKRWPVGCNMTLEPERIRQSGFLRSFLSYAVSDVQQGSFLVRSASGSFVADDALQGLGDCWWADSSARSSFRFGLCSQSSEMAHGEEVLLRGIYSDDGDWNDFGLVSPAHRKLDEIPKVDGGCNLEVEVRIYNSRLTMSHKFDNNVRHFDPMELPADVPIESWRVFVAIKQPGIEVYCTRW